MIYFSNSDLTKAHMAFIGRWSPFHKGHTAIIEKKMHENKGTPILILIRNTSTDQYPPIIRAQYIKKWMEHRNAAGTIMIIPNIEGVYWGRGVGYKTEMVDVDEQIKLISGTEIRRIMKQSNQWKDLTAHPESASMLSVKISSIMDNGAVVWLTGCPSSGKTTIAKALLKTISTQYPFLKTQLLDGDDMRNSPLAQTVGFSKTDRANHIRRMGYLASMFANHGILVVCAFVSPDSEIRTEVKNAIGEKRFTEVYVKARKKTRISRDPKGMYKLAQTGKIKKFTGYNAFYDVPQNPDITCDTDRSTIEQCVGIILHQLL